MTVHARLFARQCRERMAAPAEEPETSECPQADLQDMQLPEGDLQGTEDVTRAGG